MKLIPLTGKYGLGKFAQISDEDFEKASQIKWTLHCKKKNKRKFYVTACHLGQKIYLHSFIIGKKQGFMCDHIDGNTFNCCRENLRHVTHTENNRNKSSHTNSSSKYLGVSKSNTCWEASLCFNKKRVFRKKFIFEIEAALAYNEAAVKYFGKFANLNKISQQEIEHTNKIKILLDILSNLSYFIKNKPKIKTSLRFIKIIDTNSNITYNTFKDLCKMYDIPKTTLWRYIVNKNPKVAHLVVCK